ncbi:muts domain V-domain-containing protein [Fimicolochytrium jonesii]|uniref:muts domain V-domain-containing protein n=1 Tax=Fimicolochytrium jonesii TaxID=1396493 RepID=UPI0022FDB3C3|nr:muts domain V-domain-containing protein [Fimicolochytrium jonesii]KAI8815605.1 muts domain V-domain-containing protein [Fimicolochytrium jonesii]
MDSPALPSTGVSSQVTSSFSLDRPPTKSRRRTPRKSSAGRPLTSASTRSSRRHEGYYVVAISEGRGVASELGLAAMDLRTNECLLYQFADSQTFTKTVHKLLFRSQILLSFTLIEPVKSKLVTAIGENLPDVDLVPVSRKNFNDNVGLRYIQQYGVADDNRNFMLGLSSKFYCLSAVAALMKYIENMQNILFANQSIRFKFQVIEGTMMIDPSTARNLELTLNLTNPKSTQTLFGVLNHTCTPMGARLLRMNILQPLCALKNSLDCDNLITSLVQVPKSPHLRHAESAINNVIAFKYTLKLIESVVSAADGGDNALLLAIVKTLSDPELTELAQRLDEVVNADITYPKSAMGLRHQRCYAVKAGFNGLLDVARQTYRETTNDVYDLVTSYSEKHEINFRVVYNASLGFYITASREELGARDLPLEFINVKMKRKVLECTTLKLLSHNDRIQESLTEVYLMSDRIIAELIDDIRGKAGILFRASESLALLDMLLSFAHSCTISDCVRPEFTDTLAIKNGRHPVKESLGIVPFVPNDIFASEAANLQIITGPNMSGKSTYLRQIALLTVISQLGAFVPAEYASVRLTDKLFSRIGSDDSLEANCSTFMLEMRETAFILQNVASRSLIIIDELGRGTSTNDGLGITFAVCEELAKTQAFTFVATHFQELAAVMEVYPNVVNLHLHVEVSPFVSWIYPQNIFTPTLQMDETGANNPLKCSYTVRDGISSELHYGE